MANANDGSSTVKTATLTLFTNTGGALGPALGSWTVTNILNINGGGPTVLSVTEISGVHLNAGGNYYLQASGSGDADTSWYVNSIPLSGTLLILRSDETTPLLQRGVGCLGHHWRHNGGLRDATPGRIASLCRWSRRTGHAGLAQEKEISTRCVTKQT